ncbi:penicillin-binding protein 1A [Dongia mobilis]|uniref:Penicillin-binding protein 1A n=1 Tax=Dongia mobilis TaxID=578943 RepID=A0A4R6WV78_9PROT|nr:PBP1A family penicillin-binding protein [Dongia mobilis]TDQ83196.1 penicillin-binding protein 1A [Dongia mobilis]
MTQSDSQRASRPGRSWRWRFTVFTLKWGLVGAIWGGFVGLIFVAWCAYDLPDVSRLNEIKRRASVSLLASDGSLIASYGDLYGSAVALRDLPDYLPEAVIATEDRRFYDHFGIDLKGLARALYVNLREGRLVQGGSGITQQLAKNIFLTPERSLHRKGQEVLLALWLEQTFTKDQILELYLNRVYFGAGTYGVDAAARKYFGRPAAEVTLFEAAMLAGMLKAPSRYNPLNDRDLARDRARLVLQNMVDAGMIEADLAMAAATMTAPSVSTEAHGQIGAFYADWVLDQVSSFVGFTDADLVIETTLDPARQRMAEQHLARIIRESGPAQNASQAALVALHPDGAVAAMVGGVSYRQSQFNRATQAQRQPGSAFKAFVFAAAFDSGRFGPSSRMMDAPIRVGNWQPGNYNDKYFGDVDLREAFARSLNSVAVRLSEQIGLARVIDMAQRLGLTSPIGKDASIVLGTSEASLLEMTAAYTVFANQGRGVWPYGINRISTRSGEVLYQRSGSGPAQVVNGATVNAMLDVMGATVAWGTGRKAAIDRPAYGKTGTTQNFRDAWFIGLTADLVTGIWVGNDDNRAMDQVTGGSLPVGIWHDFMSDALAGTPPRDIPRPQGAIPVAAAAPVELVPAPASPPPEPDQSGFGALLDSILGGGSGGSSGAGGAPAEQQSAPTWRMQEDRPR